MRKLLYILSVLCTISTFSIAQVNSMSLSNALSSSDLALEFGKGGTIWCEYANGSGFPYPGFIDKKEYEYSGNTYYLNINTASILNNTCRGGGNIPSLFASIKGSENISLQYTPSNNKVSSSITFTADNDTYNSLLFAGNNTEFTGTLYLHPAITNLKFASKKSVITNISVPNVEINNGKDKDINPFIKSRNMKIICLYLPDNKDFGRLNINGNVTVDLINNCKKPTYLSFTEINKSSMYSLAVHDKIDLIINKYNDNYYSKCKCKCHKNNIKLLRDINVNCEEYKENTANKFTTLSCTATAKWQNGQSVFEYVLKCSNCNNKQIKTKSSLKHGIEHYTKYGKYFWTSEEIFKQLSQQSCSKCKYNFNKNKTSINTTSWLYLDNNCNIYAPSEDKQYAHTVNLLCAACQTPAIYFIFNETHDNIKDKLININNNCCNNISCKTKVFYDKKYINNQLSLIKDTLNNSDNCKYNFIETKLNTINNTLDTEKLSEPEINNITLAMGCINKDQISGFIDTIDILVTKYGITAQQLGTFMKGIADIDNFKKREAFMNGIAKLEPGKGKQMDCFMYYLVKYKTEAFMTGIKEMDKDKIEAFMNGVSTLKQELYNYQMDYFMNNLMAADATKITAFMTGIEEMNTDQIEAFMNGVSKLKQNNNNGKRQMGEFMTKLMSADATKITMFMNGIKNMNTDQIEAFMNGVSNLKQELVVRNYQMGGFMDNIMSADTNKITAFMTGIQEIDKDKIEAFMNGISGLEESRNKRQITAFMGGIAELTENQDKQQVSWFMEGIGTLTPDNIKTFMTKIKGMGVNEINTFMTEVKGATDSGKMNELINNLINPS